MSADDSNTPLILSIAAAAALVFGAFAPAISIPIVGDCSIMTCSRFANEPPSLGYLLIATGVATGVLGMLGNFAWLWWFGVGAFIELAIAYNRVTSAIQTMSSVAASGADSPLDELFASALALTIHVEWGWAVGFIGATLAMGAAARGVDAESSLRFLLVGPLFYNRSPGDLNTLKQGAVSLSAYLNDDQQSAPEVQRDERRACPACSELIMATARKCKHCGTAVVPIDAEPSGRKPLPESRQTAARAERQFCSECGSQILDSDQFCGRCGTEQKTSSK